MFLTSPNIDTKYVFSCKYAFSVSVTILMFSTIMLLI